MSENKNELLGNLYALRAGISAVAVEKDKADAIIKELNDNYNPDHSDEAYYAVQPAELPPPAKALREKKTAIDKMHTSNEQMKRTDAIGKNNMQSGIDDLQSKLQKSIEWRTAAEGKRKGAVVGIAIVLIFAAICLIGGAIISKTTGSGGELGGMVFMICGGVIGVGFGIPLFIRYSDLNNNYTAADNDVKMKEKGIADLRKNITDISSQDTHRIEQTALAEREYAEACEAAQREYEKQEQIAVANASPIIQRAIVMTEALIAEYDELLDHRDWENLDLVIYAIETRRADNIKDALINYADDERRTSQLVQAVEFMSDEISAGLRGLGGAFASSINHLSQQIAVSADKVSKAVSVELGMLRADMSSQNALISDGLQKIATAENMNAALLAKVKDDSSKMVREINAMRRNSDYDIYRRYKGQY